MNLEKVREICEEVLALRDSDDYPKKAGLGFAVAAFTLELLDQLEQAHAEVARLTAERDALLNTAGLDPAEAKADDWRSASVGMLDLREESRVVLNYHDLQAVGQLVSLGREKLERLFPYEEDAVWLDDVIQGLWSFRAQLSDEERRELDALSAGGAGGDGALPLFPGLDPAEAKGEDRP